MTRELLPKLTVLQAQCLADACRPCKRKDTGGRVEASLVRMGLAEHSGEILGHDDRVYKLIVATPLGRWRALGGQPPKGTR